MAVLDVSVHATSRSIHTTQIDAGFALLAAQRQVRVHWSSEPHPIAAGTELADRGPQQQHAIVAEVAGRTLVYETRDHATTYPRLAARADLYAKRSYVATHVPATTRPGSMVPLGLNMPFGLGPHRQAAQVRWLASAEGRAALRRGRRWAPGDPLGEHPPAPDLAPRVLFMARLWDPDHSEFALSPAERDERIRINDTRVAVVKALRAALGERFVGGIEHSDFAVRHFGDALAPPELSTARNDYLGTLTSFPIAVATTGLHGSQGWKLAEYVAASRAIVSEVTDREVPGPFGHERTLLEFGDVDGCVAACERLLADASLRRDLMEANAAYWSQWLRPDRLVLAPLLQAVGAGS